MTKFSWRFTSPEVFLVGWSYGDMGIMGFSLGWYFYLHLGLLHVGFKKYDSQEEKTVSTGNNISVIKGGKE